MLCLKFGQVEPDSDDEYRCGILIYVYIWSLPFTSLFHIVLFHRIPSLFPCRGTDLNPNCSILSPPYTAYISTRFNLSTLQLSAIISTCFLMMRGHTVQNKISMVVTHWNFQLAVNNFKQFLSSGSWIWSNLMWSHLISSCLVLFDVILSYIIWSYPNAVMRHTNLS